jgi:hypothetical protein
MIAFHVIAKIDGWIDFQFAEISTHSSSSRKDDFSSSFALQLISKQTFVNDPDTFCNI